MRLKSPERNQLSSGKRLLNDLVVDISTQGHALLEETLVIAFGALRFNVLIHGVDLRLI